MPYQAKNRGGELVVEIRHEAGDSPDEFIRAHRKELLAASSVTLRVWEFDGDSAFAALVQFLRRQGKRVALVGESERALEVIRMLDLASS